MHPSCSSSIPPVNTESKMHHQKMSLSLTDNHKCIEQFFTEQSTISNTIPVMNFNLDNVPKETILRQYQTNTVRWMLMRERNSESINIGDWKIDLPRGGILADEMGLGKTLEVISCILNNQKKCKNEEVIANKSVIDLSGNISASRKRKQQKLNYPKHHFFHKKPRLSDIKQNAAFKVKILQLVTEYYVLFKHKVLSKKLKGVFDENKIKIMKTVFCIFVLNINYNKADITFLKLQLWAYLISEYDVHLTTSFGYYIFAKLNANDQDSEIIIEKLVSSEDISLMIDYVTNFFTSKVLKKFEKELHLAMRYSINLCGSESIPLLEDDTVKCSCGSDKANGEKIKCTKCETQQHLLCIGTSNLVVTTDYKCPSCWMNEPPVDSSATLVVVPSTLTEQWINEIQKHAAEFELKVYWYKGVRNNYVLPQILASYDIVLVNFSTLGNELPFTNKITRDLRHVKRYTSFITPLTCIKWWRLCVDEAQTVESVNKVSEMAALLKAEHFWAVTGTPITTSIHDLEGLCTFLRIPQFLNGNKCWKDLTTGNQSSLHTLFAHIMRRKTKKEVADELGLPKLVIDTSFLSFSPVEGYFYNMTYSGCRKLFMEKLSNISNLNQPLKKACRKKVDAVLAPLLSLRQACVNPTAVGSKAKYLGIIKGGTMQNLLEKMIKKTKVDCEDILRLYIMQLNGSARIHVVSEKYADAVALYRAVLMKTNIFNDLKVDDSQKLHVMHNLYEAGIKDSNNIELSEEEKLFPVKIKELEKKCLDKVQIEIDSMVQSLSKVNVDVIKFMETYSIKEFSWWDEMFREIPFDKIANKSRELIDRAGIKIKDTHLEYELSTKQKLQSSLKLWLSNIENKRFDIFSFVNHILDISKRESLWNAAEECHIRDKDFIKNTCAICKMEDTMIRLEALLFDKVKEKIENNNANEVRGFGESIPVETNWKPNSFEYVLNALLSLSKSLFGSTEFNANASEQCKILEILRKEFAIIRTIWRKQCDLILVYDSTRMAKSTVDPNNRNDEELLPCINSTSMRNEIISKYFSDSIISYSNLQAKYGSLKYLKNLENKYLKNECINEACFVCHSTVDEKRAVMTCGHFTCYDCMQLLIGKRETAIKCPVCRNPTPLNALVYVYGGGKSNVDTSSVIGEYSAKISAVTAKVLALVKIDPTVKILVFSTWDKGLEALEVAFKQNKISFRRYNKQKKALPDFKEDKDINVLLMLLRSGSKGLNITEASNIIFTEPVLHLADEKQAIGRIDRLGQTKNMIVHRFIVNCTVEEHLHRMNEELLSSKCDNIELTFNHLRELFSENTTFDS